MMMMTDNTSSFPSLSQVVEYVHPLFRNTYPLSRNVYPLFQNTYPISPPCSHIVPLSEHIWPILRSVPLNLDCVPYKTPNFDTDHTPWGDMGLRMLSMLSSPAFACILVPCGFLHFHLYIHQHFSKNVLHVGYSVSFIIFSSNYDCISSIFWYRGFCTLGAFINK